MLESLKLQALIELIQNAFANVKRHHGITLHQAIAMDNYCSDDEIASARLKFIVGEHGKNAENQAELQVIWA
ncbi:hypothetical protein [Anabaena sp. CCY 0017]|uniref:hypothetical protein n=1 Tax=Anabaena sp. CCY 0017 TaxID=3103866 RepID=UPI0039C692DE